MSAPAATRTIDELKMVVGSCWEYASGTVAAVVDLIPGEYQFGAVMLVIKASPTNELGEKFFDEFVGGIPKPFGV